LPPALVLTSTHTLESLTVPPWQDGAGRDAALARVAHVLRDHRTGREHAMDPALLDLLVAVAAGCGVAPRFAVISGYRSPETNAALHARSAGVSAHSLHMEGRAIDVRLAGCATARLRDIALALGRGGVGYYRSLDFVHLDTGRVRRWTG